MRLAHARDGRIEVVEVGVVVERDDRDVVGNPESRLLDCLDRPQQDGVAHGEDRRGACRSAQRELRFEIPVLDREVVARDAGAILQSRPRAVRRDSPARVRVRASSGVLP